MTDTQHEAAERVSEERLRQIKTDADNFYRPEIKSMAGELRVLRQALQIAVSRGCSHCSESIRLARSVSGSSDPWPSPTQPMMFMLGEREGVLFDPQGKFHGWIMRQHPDGMWVSVRKLDAVDPADNPFSRLFAHNSTPPMAMLCDLKADGSCASAGSDFCEHECPNRQKEKSLER